jgi:hypothetical protein
MNNIFKERPLKININTNLSMKKGGEGKDTFIALKSSMFKMPGSSAKNLVSLEEYPYFSSEVNYPWSYLNSLTYRQKIEFFFNRNKFTDILSQYNQDL